ncbi:phosphocarrier protein HPr [Metasolibacillus sp. FSL H7-0170]|uniref:phosphocarrier protein HPr n=1 Tax=Metasolibacillus TaxID=2703677 RepID=UPI000D390C73|nr:phosphocarrier protein HPr [Metasolibacillus fluoroglycofenilyticus]
MANHTYTVIAESGIHARPASGIVQIASKYVSDIFMEYKEKKVNLKSILGVMSLGIGQGASISIFAEGTDQQEAVEAIESYLKSEGIIEL